MKVITAISLFLIATACQAKLLAPDSFFGEIKTAKNNATNCTRVILSIDGGGINGIIPLNILSYMEEKTGKPAAELFDYTVGTSTGGIIAAALHIKGENNKAEYSASNILQFYNQDAPKIFKTSFWYNLKNLWGVLGPRFSVTNRDYFIDKVIPKKLILNDLIRDVAIIGYGILSRRPHVFSTLSSSENKFYVTDILKGITSAPGIFAPHVLRNTQGKLVDVVSDSAIYANNPSLVAFSTAQEYFPGENLLVISLASGHQWRLISEDAALSAIDNWGLLKGGVITMLVAISAGDFNTHLQMKNIYHDKQNHLVGYYRINLNLTEEYGDPFDASASKIEWVNSSSQTLIKNNKTKIDDMIATILKAKKRRCN